MKFIGYAWLAEQFGFEHNHFHTSSLGSRLKKETAADGKVHEQYTAQYDPGKQPLPNIVFALKYEGLDLLALKYTFSRINVEEVSEYVLQNPNGKYARQVGFLYEFLTGTVLKQVPTITGNYVDIVDPEQYVVPTGVKDSKWRVNNNLPGNKGFCPLVRKTDLINENLKVNFSEMLLEITKDVPADVFKRAVNYLYFKETKSSNDIEREKPNPNKTERFVQLLRTSGSMATPERLTEHELVNNQNIIVDPRYSAESFRNDQNYVGSFVSVRYVQQTTVHLIGLPPQAIHEVMQGLAEYASKSSALNAVVKAACIAFGFVFVHPFEDGNGRLHRFLINDILATDNVLQHGVVVPISATIVRESQDYDEVLESFSHPLMKAAKYELDEAGILTVKNPEEIIPIYQYWDMTKQAEYLFSVLQKTIETEVLNEVSFIQASDKFEKEVSGIVDMPNKLFNDLLMFVHQNDGKLSKTKRDSYFSMLEDDEVDRIEAAFSEIFDPKISSAFKI